MRKSEEYLRIILDEFTHNRLHQLATFISELAIPSTVLATLAPQDSCIQR